MSGFDPIGNLDQLGPVGSMCNVVLAEEGPDGELRLYLDEGLFLAFGMDDRARELLAQWKREGGLFIPVPPGNKLRHE